MAKNDMRWVIAALYKGEKQGYVSRTYGSRSGFALTQNVRYAKKYNTLDEVYAGIDLCVKSNPNYGFMYELV